MAGLHPGMAGENADCAAEVEVLSVVELCIVWTTQGSHGFWIFDIMACGFLQVSRSMKHHARTKRNPSITSIYVGDFYQFFVFLWPWRSWRWELCRAFHGLPRHATQAPTSPWCAAKSGAGARWEKLRGCGMWLFVYFVSCVFNDLNVFNVFQCIFIIFHPRCHQHGPGQRALPGGLPGRARDQRRGRRRRRHRGGPAGAMAGVLRSGSQSP